MIRPAMGVSGFVVASPYPEGALVSLVQALADGRLARLYTSLSRPDEKGLGRVFSVSAPAELRARLQRRSWSGLASSSISDLATIPELLRIGASRLPVDQRWTLDLMYWQKRRFDQDVARELRRVNFRLLLAVQGSAARSLRVANEVGALSVLHMVNAYSPAYNMLLRQLCQLPPGHRELIPESVVRRENEEITRAKVILVPSAFVAKQLTAAGVPDSRIWIQPYGVDIGRFPPPRRRTGRSRIKVLFVGSIAHLKGVSYLVDAARKLKSLDFVLIGPIVSPETIRRLPSNVTCMGSRPFREVMHAMAEADVLTLPSIVDSYGFAALEAMASGLPVVLSSKVGAAEMLNGSQEGAGLIVNPGDVTSLHGALDFMAWHPESRREMGRRGRMLVEAEHSRQGYVEAVLARLEQATWQDPEN